MSNPERIVFLYQENYVPPEIIAMLEQHLPPNFSLDVVEQDTSSATRYAAVVAADFILGYPGDVLTPGTLRAMSTSTSMPFARFQYRLRTTAARTLQPSLNMQSC